MFGKKPTTVNPWLTQTLDLADDQTPPAKRFVVAFCDAPHLEVEADFYSTLQPYEGEEVIQFIRNFPSSEVVAEYNDLNGLHVYRRIDHRVVAEVAKRLVRYVQEVSNA